VNRSLLDALHLRPGEFGRVVWLGLIGVAYAAAVQLGDDIAQSIFVTRISAERLPRIFLFKALLNIAAAAMYVPITRGRSPAKVWRIAIVIYVAAIIGGRAAVVDGGQLTAYILYVAHECAWTILTLHWAVFILDVFDASQARRLFPLLFTFARLGGVLAGALLSMLAGPLGAVNLLLFAAGLAAIAGLLSLFDMSPHLGVHAQATSPLAAPDETTVSEEAEEEERGPPRGLFASWRYALESPLVRAIALSTFAMVIVRYGLRIVSLDEISESLGHREDIVAEFLGMFSAIANVGSALLGVFVVPRLLSRYGVGAVNLVYAGAALIASSLLIALPLLATAAVGRFVDQQFKGAIKTPLSALFYGAEPPERRAPARAFVFGAVIPAAAIVTFVIFELVTAFASDLMLISAIAAGISILFIAACSLQNRRWRDRLVGLLETLLDRDEIGTDEATLAKVRAVLSELERADPKRIELVASGLASRNSRIRAVAEEVLSETIARRSAHQIARELREHAT
jgi:ATP/ADP translocase